MHYYWFHLTTNYIQHQLPTLIVTPPQYRHSCVPAHVLLFPHIPYYIFHVIPLVAQSNLCHTTRLLLLVNLPWSTLSSHYFSNRCYHHHHHHHLKLLYYNTKKALKGSHRLNLSPCSSFVSVSVVCVSVSVVVS